MIYRKVRGKFYTWYISEFRDIWRVSGDGELLDLSGDVKEFPLVGGGFDRVKGPWNSNHMSLYQDTGIDTGGLMEEDVKNKERSEVDTTANIRDRVGILVNVERVRYGEHSYPILYIDFGGECMVEEYSAESFELLMDRLESLGVVEVDDLQGREIPWEIVYFGKKDWVYLPKSA